MTGRKIHPLTVWEPSGAADHALCQAKAADMTPIVMAPSPPSVVRSVYRFGSFPPRVFCCTPIHGIGSEEVPARLPTLSKAIFDLLILRI